LYLFKTHENIGETILYPKRVEQFPEYYGIGWAINKKLDEISYLFEDYLTSTKRYLDRIPDSNQFKISPLGWAYLDSLKQINPESKMAFVAVAFALEKDIQSAIEDAIRQARYEPNIISDHNHINKIDDEIIAFIRKSNFLVADFTGQNANVSYEAGFARGLELPVISTCKQSEIDGNKLPFDTRQYATIGWEIKIIEEFKNRLKSTIEANII
jgi:hypothetical protein